MREQYTTPSGIVVARTLSKIPYQKGLAAVLRRLDKQRGIYLSSGYEYPGRYSRWDVAAAAPPLEIIAAGREVVFRALSERGKNLLKILRPVLEPHPHWSRFAVEEDSLPDCLKITHRNLNDNTIAGVRHQSLPAFSVQYHPEAGPGPHDSRYLFDMFAELIDSNPVNGKAGA